MLSFFIGVAEIYLVVTIGGGAVLGLLVVRDKLKSR